MCTRSLGAILNHFGTSYAHFALLRAKVNRFRTEEIRMCTRSLLSFVSPRSRSRSKRSPLECIVGHLWASYGQLGTILGLRWLSTIKISIFPKEYNDLWVYPDPILGPPGAILRPSWGHLGPSWGHLGPCWGEVGTILGHLAVS